MFGDRYKKPLHQSSGCKWAVQGKRKMFGENLNRCKYRVFGQTPQEVSRNLSVVVHFSLAPPSQTMRGSSLLS